MSEHSQRKREENTGSATQTYALQLALAANSDVQRVFVKVPVGGRHVQLHRRVPRVLGPVDRAPVRHASRSQAGLQAQHSAVKHELYLSIETTHTQQKTYVCKVARALRDARDRAGQVGADCAGHVVKVAASGAASRRPSWRRHARRQHRRLLPRQLTRDRKRNRRATATSGAAPVY